MASTIHDRHAIFPALSSAINEPVGAGRPTQLKAGGRRSFAHAFLLTHRATEEPRDGGTTANVMHGGRQLHPDRGALTAAVTRQSPQALFSPLTLALDASQYSDTESDA
jgi:hypothetical protein